MHMEFSLHEQRTLARIEEELSGDRRLTGLAHILDSKKKRWRRLKSLGCRLRHPRQDVAFASTHHRHVLDTRPLLALTVLLTVVCTGVLVMSLVIGSGTLVVFAASILPLPPALALLAYLRLRRAGRPRRR